MNIKAPLAAALAITALIAITQPLPTSAQSAVTPADMTNQAGPFVEVEFLGSQDCKKPDEKNSSPASDVPYDQQPGFIGPAAPPPPRGDEAKSLSGDNLPNPNNVSPAAKSGGKEDGETIAALQATMNTGARSGIKAAPLSETTPDSNDNKSDVAGPDKQEVIKVAGNASRFEPTGYTYIRIAEAAKNSDAIIEGGAATFKANPSLRADPPVDPKYLGKIQASANE